MRETLHTNKVNDGLWWILVENIGPNRVRGSHHARPVTAKVKAGQVRSGQVRSSRWPATQRGSWEDDVVHSTERRCQNMSCGSAPGKSPVAGQYNLQSEADDFLSTHKHLLWWQMTAAFFRPSFHPSSHTPPHLLCSYFLQCLRNMPIILCGESVSFPLYKYRSFEI